MAQENPVEVTGIWLRSIGDKLEVLAEIDGEFRLVITESMGGPMSHIAEVSGMLKAPVDRLATK